MPAVQKKDRESFEVMLRRFRRTCDNAGIISRCRFLESYEKPTWARKRKNAAIKKRQIQANRYTYRATGSSLTKPSQRRSNNKTPRPFSPIKR